jgi:acyl-coenzyme A synthetase/AMP-(fatty) acid ligase
MLSHENALAYIDWCAQVFAPRPDDVFSSHAPLHFDLSVLDVFLSIGHGARLVLIGEEAGKDPARLAPLIAEKRITVWYSAPSILTLLAQYGDLDRRDFSALRLVLFAGEVFPLKHLRALKALWKHPRYFNLYGPTETNVCTFHEVPPEIPPDRTEPFPIGKPCAHYRIRLCDENGREVQRGGEGEVWAAGPSVMMGYWNLADANARAFHLGPDGERWYRTGDIAVEDADGSLRFLGRRDRMIKRRGYRVELGEIEAALYRFPDVEEAAAVALADEEAGVRIKVFLALRGERRPSLIALKRFCAENLPLYMVPDLFEFPGPLPKTSTGKIDYQTLKSRA